MKNEEFDQEKIIHKVVLSLKKLLEKDQYLIEVKANERAITAKLSCYLQKEFPHWNVDHEYNRDNEDPKRVGGSNIYPDIIIHNRGKAENLLVIEVKKSTDDRSDKIKLKGIKQQFSYQYAYFINIDMKKDVCEWIEVI